MTSAEADDSQAAGDATGCLQRLRGVKWAWREEAPAEAHALPGMGVIAQDVEAVFPELIEHSEQGFLRVEYDGLVPPLMLAAGELDARLRLLEQATRGAAVTADEQAGGRMPERLQAATGSELRTDLDPDMVAGVFPELVVTDESGERVVVYPGLVGVLIEAVKELDARVSALEAAGRAG